MTLTEKWAKLMSRHFTGHKFQRTEILKEVSLLRLPWREIRARSVSHHTGKSFDIDIFLLAKASQKEASF